MNYKLAFALGLIAPGTVGREPVAYLYNGVRLPGLPSGYQYAAITHNKNNQNAVLTFSTFPLYADRSNAGIFDYALMGKISGAWKSYIKNADSNTGWEPQSEEAEYAPGQVVSAVGGNWYTLWANHEIEYDDGTILIEASEPVPVYE